MARPAHYSRDIVARCQSLLKHLAPTVGKGLPEDKRFGGTLTTTLLLALSTPMVVLPVERIFKPSQGNTGLGDDSALHEGLGKEAKRVLGGKTRFADTPFFHKGDWSYLPDQTAFNVAQNWPPAILKGLAEPKAMEAAANAPASKMIGHLRNALAHGNVTYLDSKGDASDRPAAMYGFASARMDYPKCAPPQITGLHAWRVSEEGFRRFLDAWAAWIEKAGVAQWLNEASALTAPE
jgi:hypothetical protein